MLKMKNGDTPSSISFNGNDVDAVSYNGEIVWLKYSGAETWVLNQDISSTIGEDAEFTIDFKADGVVFNTLSVVTSGSEKILKYDTISAYSTAQNKWATDGYRTLIFDNAPIGVLRDWLTANGTKK